MKELVVGKEVVTDMRLEPENSTRNSAVEVTAKEKVREIKNQTLPKQPNDPRSLARAFPGLSPKNVSVEQSKQDREPVRFFCITFNSIMDLPFKV